MATLEKKTLTGLLGQKAGTKLYHWLNPCCQVTYRAEAICVDGQICIDYYAISSITQTVFVNTGTRDFSVGGIIDFFNLVPGDNFLGRGCGRGGGNPTEGTYNFFAQTLTSGEPIMGFLYTVDVPFCDG
jgi:hypothetical protein